MSTLIIRPKTGKFVKDVELIGKMDPFIEITINGEMQKTETAYNQGKTPVWKNALNFRLTQEQINQPSKVDMKIEAYDEDKRKKNFLGATTYNLSQVRIAAGSITSIELKDKKNKLAGVIEVEFEIAGAAGQLADSPNLRTFNTMESLRPGMTISNFQRPMGTVIIKPTEGRVFNNAQDSDEYYLVVAHSSVTYQSMVSQGNGKSPIFKDIISFQLFEGPDLIVKCFNNNLYRNELVGEGVVQLSTLLKKGKLHEINVSLSVNQRQNAELKLEIEFFPEVFENLVKVYPPMQVRRNDYLFKKIRYSNPDRYQKTLMIRSENNGLISIKTENLIIKPNDFGEIRFQVSAPYNNYEERCRVDVIHADSGMVEETLLFTVRGV